MAMSIFTALSEEAISRLRSIGVTEYEEPQFKLGEVVTIAAVDTTPKDVQNWTNRKFLKPRQAGLRKDKLYSLKNIVEASVIGHLSMHNSFVVSHEVALAVGHRAGCLIAEGYYRVTDFWESENLTVYYYTITSEGYPRGVWLSRQDLAQVVLGEKSIPGVVGLEKRLFEADDLILRVLVNYVNYVLHPAPKRKKSEAL
jgi:hypothetical protein